MKKALFVIDMQAGLLDRVVYHKEELLVNVNKLIDYFHDCKQPVLLIRHNNDNLLKMGSPGWQFHPAISEKESDILVNKTHSSVFEEKGFAKMLEGNHIDEVVITGVVTNGCVKEACLGAKAAGFPVTLISDAHSTNHKDAAMVIDEWHKKLAAEGITLMTTKEFLEQHGQ